MKVKLLEDDDIGDEFAMTREQLEHDASAECDEDYNGTASSEEGQEDEVGEPEDEYSEDGEESKDDTEDDHNRDKSKKISSKKDPTLHRKNKCAAVVDSSFDPPEENMSPLEYFKNFFYDDLIDHIIWWKLSRVLNRVVILVLDWGEYFCEIFRGVVKS